MCGYASAGGDVSPELPEGKFGAILADPPWSFLTYGKKRTTPHRGANEHYKTLTAQEIREIRVTDLAAKDCALFMWVVDSHFDEALMLGKAWGFEFKTIAFIWLKSAHDPLEVGFFPAEPLFKIGMGYWTRKQAEICLLFTRGKPKRLSKGVRQVIASARREHSRKPEDQYARIEALVVGPYLEMFARKSRLGWTSWGNEVGKFE